MGRTRRAGDERARRPDLQGLRGIGIALVVVGHVSYWPPGAFAALDIFFVLSGFLITGILLDAHERFGRVYFVPFYLSRLRRLLPTALTVIGATTAAAFLLFSGVRGRQVAEDGAWAAAWLANWHFTRSGTEYFAELGTSPLLHYWSLSVEEQFYAVWPLLLFVVLALAAHRGRSARGALATVFTAVLAGAFAYSWRHSGAAPSAAYLSTLDRTWEFAAGGLLALVRPELGLLGARARSLLAWAGAVALGACLALLDHGVRFPAPWAVPAVLATAGIIASGVAGPGTLRWLECRPLVYLGNISYSLYLWHFPLLVLAEPLVGGRTVTYYLLTVPLVAAVSVASYHLLERPLRLAPWLMTAPERRAARAALRRRSEGMRRVRDGWLVVGGLTAVVASGVLVLPTAPQAGQAPLPVTVAAQQGDGSADTRTSDEVVAGRSALQAALAAGAFPDFDPPLSSLTFRDWSDQLDREGCTNVGREDLGRCRFGSTAPGAPLAVVVGDSYAMAYAPGIRAALEPRGWAVQQLTRGRCPTWTLPSYVNSDGTPFPECAEQHDLVQQVLEGSRPELLVLADADAHVRNRERADLPDDGARVAREGLSETLRRWAPLAARTVVLAPAPSGVDLTECVSTVRPPSNCVVRPDREWRAQTTGEAAAVAAAGTTAVSYVQTRDWFCVADRCPAFVGTTPVRASGGHLSIPFSKSLRDLLAPVLLPPGADALAPPAG